MTQADCADDVDVDLNEVAGIGDTAADNLRDVFGTDDVAMDAALSIPDWVRNNIAHIGEKNLANLQEVAEKTGHKSSESGNWNLDDKKWEKYDKYYRPVGETTDNRVLFYSGYFQGHSYKTQITRQVWSKDKVNKYIWAFWSWSEWDFVFLSERNHPSNLHDNKLADLVDDHEWKRLSEFGLVEYQRGRYYELDDWPNNAKGHESILHLSNFQNRERRTLRSMELVGITKDRIAIYNQTGTLHKFVRLPDGTFYELHGRTKYATDRDLSLGEFGTVKSFVKKLADNDEWKTYGSTTYVTDKYQQHL